MIDFSQVKKWLIGGVEVKKVVRVLDSTVLWQAISRVLKQWRGLSPLICTPTVANPFEEVRVYGDSKQGVLPSGYTQLDYIQSTGAQYIDTGVKPSVAYTWFKGKIVSTATNLGLGCREASGTTKDGVNVFFNYTGKVGFTRLDWVDNDTGATRELGDGSGIYDIKYLGCGKYDINGHSETVTPKQPIVQTTRKSYNYYIGCNNQDGTAKFGASQKIYHCSLYYNDGSGDILEFDGIPAKRNSDNVLGMYDTVSNTFFTNKGTGSFTAGDVTTPTPDTPIPVESVGDKQVLPYGYTQLDYLDSTGTQYIDTGIKANINQVVDIEYTKIAVGFVFGVRGASNFGYCGITNEATNGTYNVRWGESGASIYTSSTQPEGRIKVHIENKNVTINDSVVSTKEYGTKYNDLNIFVFQINANGAIGSTNYGTNRIHKFTISENGVETINLIPAKRNSDNVLGMYDTVSNTFFTNKGTGSFTAGDVIGQGGYKVPVEVSGKNLFDKNNIVDGYRLRNGVGYGYEGGNDFVSATGFYTSSLIEVKVGKTYTKNSPNEDAYHRYHTYNADKVSVRQIDANTITINDNEKYVAFCGRVGELNTTQFEQGSTTTNLYLSEPLRKIGTFADTVNVVNSKNLFNPNVETFDGYITSSKTVGDKITYTSSTKTKTYKRVAYLKAGSYTYSFKNSPISGSAKIVICDDDEIILFDTTVSIREGYNSQKITTDVDGWIYITTIVGSNDIQLEQGDTATSYEPYGATATVTRNVKAVDFKDLNFIGGYETAYRRYTIEGINPKAKDYGLRYGYGLSTALSIWNTGGSATAVTNNSFYWSTDTKIHIVEEVLKDVALMQQKLTGQYLYYQLATPTTETYTIDTPINALDNTSIITVDTQTPPSEIYASEWVEE